MLSEVHRLKGVFGYTKSGCEAPPGWAYTIGLSEMCGHPELVVVGLDEAESAEVLDAAAARVVAGGRLAAGGSLRLMGHDFGVVAVHPRHWDTAPSPCGTTTTRSTGPPPRAVHSSCSRRRSSSVPATRTSSVAIASIVRRPTYRR